MIFTYQLLLMKEHKTIKVLASGEADNPADIESMFTGALDLMEEHGFKRMLLDAKNLHIVYSSDKVMDIMRRMKDEKWFEGKRLARLLREDDYAQSLLEDIAEKLALPVKNFETQAEALEWLAGVE